MQLRPPIHPVHASQTNDTYDAHPRVPTSSRHQIPNTNTQTGITGTGTGSQNQTQLQVTRTSHHSHELHPQQLQYQSPSRRQSAVSSIPSTQSFYSTPTRVTQPTMNRISGSGSRPGTGPGPQSHGRVNQYLYPQNQQYQSNQLQPVHPVHPPQHTPTRGGNHDYSGNHQANQQRMMYQQYVQQRMAQQQQYTSYVQQQQYQYYHMIGQQYGYNAMIAAMQRNPTMTNYVRHLHQKKQQQMQSKQSTPSKSRDGSIMLSAEDQPLLRSAEKKKKRRRKRKRTVDEDGNEHYVMRSETVSLDLSDEELEESVEMGFDQCSFIVSIS